MEKRSFTRVNAFQDNIAQGRPNQWRCRAGSRYLYICEDGLVHYCSQQRGYPGIPLEKYTRGGHAAGIRDGEILRAALHGVVRAPGVDLRFLARPAASGLGCGGRARSDRVGGVRHPEYLGAISLT